MRNFVTARRMVNYAIGFRGTAYRYGTDMGRGDDPIRGFDCSGLVSEVLRSVGLMRYRDRLSAQDIHDHFIEIGKPAHDAEDLKILKQGMLIFYGKGGKVTHVAIAINRNQVIEAGGGSSDTLDDDRASIRNAFVRIRPWDYRSDILSIVDVCR